MIEYTIDKITQSYNESIRNLEQMNLSSHAPSSQYIVPHSQFIADQNQNHDANKHFKLSKKGWSKWLC